MPDAYSHPAALDPERLAEQCLMRRSRRRGPGGQHRNKVETAIVLEHRPTGVTAEATERRSQGENRTKALQRLRLNLALEIRTTNALPGPPSELCRSRCGGGPIAVSAAHRDFPALLAEVLDRVAAQQGDVKPVAEALGTTASQLIKFLKKDPRAFALVNRWRAAKGWHTLH